MRRAAEIHADHRGDLLAGSSIDVEFSVRDIPGINADQARFGLRDAQRREKLRIGRRRRHAFADRGNDFGCPPDAGLLGRGQKKWP